MSLQTCPQCAAPLPDGAPAGTLCPACTAEASARTVIQPAPTAAAATVIGDFQIIDKLGQGGMGAVYRARQLSLDRLVALKVLPEQFSGDPEFLARFQREARVAASLQHPNLVRVFSAGHADACHYIAMELIDGENLHQRLKRERLAIPEALRICTDVARGLEFGWDRAQLIHRDIKPANIYLSHAGEVKVGDLGIAKSLTGETTGLTQTGTMMGTPYYMSPEQIRGDKTLDFRADVYSLGCTLYEMLTGKPPYPGSDPITIARAHLDAPLPAILKALPGCPIPLARLVGRMLKKSPRERHASYADLIAEMDSVMQVLVHGDASAGRVAAAWKQFSEDPVLTMPRPATARPPTTAAPAAKSKLPLYGAIAAGVLVLGAVAFVVMKPRKVGTAVPSRPPVGSTPNGPLGTAVPTIPSPTATSLSPATGPWVDALAEYWAKEPTSQRGVLTREAGGSSVTRSGIALPMGAHRDTALRATVARSAGWRFQFRFAGTGSLTETYKVEFSRSTTGKIILHVPKGGKDLQTFTLPPGVSLAERHTIEARIQGDTLTCLVNGLEVARVQDDRIKDAGPNHFAADAGTLIEKLEYRTLSALAPAVTATDGPWVDGLAEWWAATANVKSGLLIEEAGGRRMTKKGTLFLGRKPLKDAALRATFQVQDADTGISFIFFRDPEKPEGAPANTPAQPTPRAISKLNAYRATLSKIGGHIILNLGDQHKDLKRFPPSAGFSILGRHTVEIRVQGDTLTYILDGTTLGTVQDTTLPTSGTLGFGPSLPGTLIEKLEYRELPAPARAVPASGDDARTFGGHRYAFVPGALEWPAAKARAEALGGHLATLTTQEESDWVIAQFRDRFTGDHTGMWLGASTDAKTGGWKWVTGEPFSFTAWGTDEPNGGLQGEPPYYLNLFRAPNYPSGIAWNDTPLTYRFWRQQNLGFLVEWDAPPAPGEQPQPAPVKLFTTAEKLGTPDPRRIWDNGVIRLDGTGAVASSFRARDMIVRGSIRANPDANSPAILFRTRMEGGVPSHYVFALDATRREVLLRVLVAGNDRVLKKWPLPRAYGPDEWVRLEIKAVGDQFTASADGQVLGTVRDATLAQPGGINIHATAKGYFRDIEYVPLDATAAPQSPAPAVGGGAWVDALAAWWASPEVKRGLLVKEADGSKIADSSRGIAIATGRDLAVRATARAPRGSNWRLSLRYGGGGQGSIATNNFSAQLVAPGRPSVITSTVGGTNRTLKEFPLPPGFAIEQPHTMEFSAQGDVLTLRLDGQEVARVQDDSLMEAGRAYINGEVGTLIEKLEYRELPPARP